MCPLYLGVLPLSVVVDIELQNNRQNNSDQMHANTLKCFLIGMGQQEGLRECVELVKSLLNHTENNIFQ